MSARRPVARQRGLTVTELDGETIVYDLASHAAHCLNAPAADVWRHCDGKRDEGELAAFYEAELGGQGARQMVAAALGQLSRAALLEDPLSGGLSRREWLKWARRAGTASVVLTPVVASLAIPAAAAAASCLGTGAPCSQNSDCCSNICSGTTCA